MTETREIRLKRLSMRSARRGMKEMDLILGGFAARGLAALGPEDLDRYESLLAENDQEIFLWLTGREAPPARYAALLALILPR